MISLPSVYPVTCHTDFVTQGTTFVAISGMKKRGADFIELALQKGASRIVVESGQYVDEEMVNNFNAEVVYVENARKALALLSAQAAGHPAKKLKIIGITGTKGKTTTTHILTHLLSSLGFKVASLNTVYNMINGETFKPPLTTAQPDYLHQFFKCCVEQDIEYVVMEVAAQAFTFDRVHELLFDAAIFTNLDKEHGELYATQEEYFGEKAKLFLQLKDGAPALINADDEYGKKLLSMHQKFKGYSLKTKSDYQASFEAVFQKGECQCSFLNDGQRYSFFYKTFPGLYNGYNILAAVATLFELGFSLESLRNGLNSLPSLSGRLEEYSLPNGACAFIDYAHTPGSFAALFELVRQWTDDLIVVFGAGGGKDHEKRPLMGKIATHWADKVILTSDNPRFESVEDIIASIERGIEGNNLLKVFIEKDRKKAIEKAYALSKKGSIILLLGKGPDEHEIIQGNVLPFQEKLILMAL